METRNNDKSIAQLFSDLTREITTLMRQEVGLVKKEVSEKVNQGKNGLISLVIGGAVAYAGLLVLLFAAVFALGKIMELWLAALAVAVVVLIIGMVMISKAKANLKAENLVPRRSVESLKRDTHLAQQHTRQGVRT